MALLIVSLGCACKSKRAEPSPQQKTPAATAAALPAAQSEPPVASSYGVVPGRRSFDEKDAPDYYIREKDYPPGVFAVSTTLTSDHPRLLAFDVKSNGAAICTRIGQPTFELRNSGNMKYTRFRCPGDWSSRDVVFLDAPEYEPKHAEVLEWSALGGPSPLPMPREKRADLHDYAAVARASLLDGKWLVSAAWFSGEYPPRKEPDELRGDTIAFGHYQLLDRTLFIGESLKPSTVLYRASEPTEVREGIEWAFLPQTASEKTRATISALYEIPNGYLLRVFEEHDHEGFGVDESTYFYAWEMGRWRLLAKAEQTRLY
jgi:hypothetical protein